MGSLATEADLVQENLDLTKALDKALVKLAERGRNDARLVEAAYEGARDAGLALKIPRSKVPKVDKRTKQAEIAVPLYSDLQLAKVTPSYNTHVAEERTLRYAKKIIEITDLQRSHHPVREVVVCALGDIIEGLLIFPGQHYLVDAGIYRQIMIDGPRIVAQFLDILLGYFEKVTVMWIIGNHGRIGRRGEMDPETNGDRMLGKLLEMLYEGDPRISFVVPDGMGETNFYYVARKELGNYHPMLLHGYQFKGGAFGGLPYYGFKKKVDGWGAGGLGEPFGDVFSGHYHQCAQIPIGKRTIYQNGTLESTNTYAQEELATMSDPQQWLLFVDPQKGRVTSSWKVDLL